MQWLLSFATRSPKRTMAFGKALFLVGSILVLGAVFSRAALQNVNADRAAAKQPPLQTLAQAWPQRPTWVVPEGPVGFVIAGVLVVAGMTLILLAEKAGKR